MIKILYTSKVQGHPAIGGPKLRIENSIKALNQVSQLHLLIQVKKAELGGQEGEDFYKGLCSSYEYLPSVKGGSKFADRVYRAINKYMGKDAIYICDYARRNGIKIIWLGYGNISYKLIKSIKRIAPELKVISDTDSVWSKFIFRKLGCLTETSERIKVLKEGQKYEREEMEWVELCDCVTAVSKIDAEYYEYLTSNPKKVHLFSNVIDLDNYDKSKVQVKKVNEPQLFLAGTFWKGSPMEYAARWLIQDILPLVMKEIPNIRLCIAGFDSDVVLADIKNKNVEVLGTVDSVLPYLFASKAALVPLRFESGTRFKILEAGACKIPIVSTTLGAEGIPVTNNKDIMIADDTISFAEAIIKLLGDEDFSISMVTECYNLVKEKNSIDSLKNEAIQIIDYLKDK